MVLVGLFSSSLAMFIFSGVLIGLGLSALLGAPLRYIMLNESRLEERSVAQGVVAIFSSAGQLLGGALTGAIASSRTGSGGAGAGYSLAFLVIGGISLVLAVLALQLKSRQAEQAAAQTPQTVG